MSHRCFALRFALTHEVVPTVVASKDEVGTQSSRSAITTISRRMGRSSHVARVGGILLAVALIGSCRAAEPCMGLASGLFVDSQLSAEPTADVAPRANYRVKIGITLGNVGQDWLNLQTLRIPFAFSRRVKSSTGAWVQAAPQDFIISCWPLEKARFVFLRL
jgi:hypothetical protein